MRRRAEKQKSPGEGPRPIAPKDGISRSGESLTPTSVLWLPRDSLWSPRGSLWMPRGSLWLPRMIAHASVGESRMLWAMAVTCVALTASPPQAARMAAGSTEATTSNKVPSKRALACGSWGSDCNVEDWRLSDCRAARILNLAGWNPQGGSNRRTASEVQRFGLKPDLPRTSIGINLASS